jgi:hypothetical protein
VGDSAWGRIDPCPDRTTATWATLLRSQAQALLAADFIETVTLTGTRMYILAGYQRLQRRGAQRSVQRAAGIDDHPGGELAAVGQPHDVDAEAAARRPALAA